MGRPCSECVSEPLERYGMVVSSDGELQLQPQTSLLCDSRLDRILKHHFETNLARLSLYITVSGSKVGEW